MNTYPHEPYDDHLLDEPEEEYDSEVDLMIALSIEVENRRLEQC